MDELINENKRLNELLESVYRDRNNIVQLLAKILDMQDRKAGIRVGTENDDWPVVAMDLPYPVSKQIAWHIPKDQIMIDSVYKDPYDGHTNEEKEKYIRDFLSYEVRFS